MAAISNDINYLKLEQTITTIVKDIGNKLPDTEEHKTTKKTIESISNIIFENKDKGILELGFNNKSSIYHRLSKERGLQLISLDKKIQKAALHSISQEIVDSIGIPQTIINLQLPSEISNRMFQKFENPDESIKTFIDCCRMVDFYKIKKETACVISMKNEAGFNVDLIFKSILSKTDYDNYKDAQLIEKLISFLKFTYADNNLNYLSITIINEEAFELVRKEVYERYVNPETNMKYIVNDILIKLAISTKNVLVYQLLINVIMTQK